MAIAALYITTLLIFLSLEAAWLTTVMRPLFMRHVGALLVDDVRLIPAAGFYLLHGAGLTHFATLPALRGGGPAEAALNGALLGALVYGAYEMTNMATLKGWSWSMVAADMAGGAAISAIACAGFSPFGQV